MLEGVFRGDRRECRKFLEKFLPMIHAVARKVRTRDAAWELDDLVHEALLVLFEQDFRKLRSFKFRCRLSTYIYTVVWRHLISKMDSRDRDFHALDDGEDIGSGVAPEWEWDFLNQPGPAERLDEAAVARERGRIMGLVVGGLDPEEALLWTCLREGRSVEDTVRILQYRDRDQRDKAKFNLIKKMRKQFLQLAEGANHG